MYHHATSTTPDDGLRRSPARQLVLGCGLLCWLCTGLLCAQPASDEPRLLPSRERTFRIPFQTQPGERRLREVQLYYSVDQGRTWRPYATATPEQGYFQQFTAPTDGQYWFSVRT